jgi:hypothetical protein
MDSAISDTPPPAPHRRARFEIIFASIWLGIGLLVLPAAIYFVGVLMLGPYKPGAGLMQFYTDLFSDLAAPTLRAWMIVLGPLILITVIRLVFLGVPRSQPAAQPAPPPPSEEPVRPPPKARERVEPRIGTD